VSAWRVASTSAATAAEPVVVTFGRTAPIDATRLTRTKDPWVLRAAEGMDGGAGVPAMEATRTEPSLTGKSVRLAATDAIASHADGQATTASSANAQTVALATRAGRDERRSIVTVLVSRWS